MITPSPASLAAQAQAELITQPLYDSENIATSATSATFFDGTNSGNRLLTNVDANNGTLAHPKFFRVGGIRLVVNNPTSSGAQLAPENHVADVITLIYYGWYELTLGGLKPYIQVPNFFLPGGVGVVARGFIAEADAAGNMFHSANNGEAIFGQFYRLKHWISIPPLQSFQAVITFPTAITLNATTRMWNFLDGEFGREVL